MKKLSCPNCQNKIGVLQFLNTTPLHVFKCEECKTDLKVDTVLNGRLVMYFGILLSCASLVYHIVYDNYLILLATLALTFYVICFANQKIVRANIVQGERTPEFRSE